MPPDPGAPPGNGDSAPDRREALIWVSGLGEDGVDQSVATISRHLAAGLDLAAGDAAISFPTAIELRKEQFGPDGARLETEVSTIFRKDSADAEKVPVIDVYRLRTQDVLVDPFLARGAISRVLLGISTIRVYRTRALAVAKRGTMCKTRKERRQLLVSQIYLAALFVYLAFLAVAAIATFLPPDNPVLRYLAHGPALVLTVVGIWKARVLPLLVRAAAQNVSVVRYLEHSEGLEEIRGRLDWLLDHVESKPAVQYRDIKVVGYSFGTIALIDSLMPAGGPPSDRLSRISALVTIACPFDFVRTYWPAYFDGRHVREHLPRRWLNVYDPNDVLGSNFRPDPDVAEAQDTVTPVAEPPQPTPPTPRNIVFPSGAQPREASLVGTLTLIGLQLHGRYWPSAASAANTAFTPIARELYAGSEVLSDSAALAQDRR